MIDLKYYAQTSLSEEDSKLFIKIFGNYKFCSLWQMIKQLENIEEKLDWVTQGTYKQKLIELCNHFSISLKELLPTFSDKLEFSLRDLNVVDSFQNEFEFKKNSHGGICPKCGEKELFVPKQGTAKSIKCSRENQCGYSSSIYNYLVEEKNMSPKDALEELASLSGVDLKAYEQSLEIHTIETQPKIDVKTKKKVLENQNRVKKETQYMKFDTSKKYTEVDFKKMLEKYHDGSMKEERQKFIMVVSAIYYFSLQTNQTGKGLYYKSRGISSVDYPALTSKVQQIVDEVGYLDAKKDIPDLINSLTQMFPVEDLIEFGVINDANHKVPYSFKHYSEVGFCIIPNKDLYTNMITGLKLRNVKLADWQSGNMKEPELSYSRIANPLPYGLTRDAFINKATFRFQEGSVDSFSLPEGNNTCDVSIAGVNGISDEQLGLFAGQNCEIWYDQDDAGQIAAWGAIKFNLNINSFEVDFKSKSFIDELKKLNDKAIKIKQEDNKATIEEIKIPNTAANSIRIKTIETILNRRNIAFKRSFAKGLKQKLESANVAFVSVRNWNKTLGSDVNEALKARNIFKI